MKVSGHYGYESAVQCRCVAVMPFLYSSMIHLIQDAEMKTKTTGTGVLHFSILYIITTGRMPA